MDQYLVPGESLKRLFSDYKAYGSLSIGYDFDNTVYDFHKQGHTYDLVIQLIKDLKSIGCTVICWTANKDHTNVIKYLEDNNIPFDGINTDGIKLPWTSRKPFYSALLDDRAGLIQVYNELRTFCDQTMLKNECDLNSLESQSTEQ